MSKIEKDPTWKCDLCGTEVNRAYFPQGWTTYRFKKTMCTFSIDLHACTDCKWSDGAFVKWLKNLFAKKKSR